MQASSIQSKSKGIKKSKKIEKVFNKKGLKDDEGESDVFEIIVEDQEEEKKQWEVFEHYRWDIKGRRKCWLNIQKDAFVINKNNYGN